jgi:hypothetical protein
MLVLTTLKGYGSCGLGTRQKCKDILSNGYGQPNDGKFGVKSVVVENQINHSKRKIIGIVR